MKCYYHPDLESANTCTVCSRFLCVGCSHSIRGKFYCQDCLVQGAELAAVARSPEFTNYSPGRAALFGLIPGVGAVYNRQYSKAIAHIGIFSALVIMADHGPGIFVMASIAFYIFTLIDAYRSAEAIRRRAAIQGIAPSQEGEGTINLPIWGGLLVLMGVVFFLDNVGALDLEDVADFGWPLLFVAAGIYMILYYFLQAGQPSRVDRMKSPPAVGPDVPTKPPVVSGFDEGGKA